MSRLPEFKKGEILKVRTRPLPFSYWPMIQGKRRNELHLMIFARSPWAFIKNIINTKYNNKSKDCKIEALAYIDQAEDFYESAKNAKIEAAKPLLIYYCFMNLIKAFIITKSEVSSLSKARHGISVEAEEKGISVLKNQVLSIYPYSVNNQNLFDKFGNTLARSHYKYHKSYYIKNILSQIVAGHRIFAKARGIREKFISIESFNFYVDKTEKNTWIRFYIYSDDLERIDIRQKNVLVFSRLNSTFKQVKSIEKNSRRLLNFELETPLIYTQRPADKSRIIVDSFRHYLWAMITSMPPYRKYYLYLVDKKEHVHLLPQLLSIYALFYYLGSVTRYQPHLFTKILNGKYGAQIMDIINSQPNQFIYHMASEFAEQDVTQPAIV